MAWVENSVTGLAAEIVFCIPRKGYIACRRSRESGEIVLVGVKEDFQDKGVGTALVRDAMRWFNARGLDVVSVMTQLKNLRAMNFFRKLGFTIKAYDMVFAKIL